MEIRSERTGDRPAVRELHLAAFGDEGPVVAAIVEDLRERSAADGLASLVAVESDVVLGHVVFSPGLLDAPPRLVSVAILSPIGVRPDRQREGIGSALIRHGLAMLDERSVPLVFLEGHPGYYPRFGFRPGGELGFRKPSLRIPDAAFQVLPLAAYEPWMTGTLVYPQVFWDHDAVGLRE